MPQHDHDAMPMNQTMVGANSSESSPHQLSLAPSWVQGDSNAPTRHGSVADEKLESPQSPSTPLSQSAASSNPNFCAIKSYSDPEKGLPLKRILTAKDWSGPDDPGNAHNWPTWKKVYHTCTISGIALVGTFASSAYTPGIDQVATEFNVGTEVATLAYAIYVLGLAAGAPLASPLSETLGRKYVYLTCMPIFALFILGTGFAPNIGSLIVFRFLAGVFGSPSLSIGSATISDLYPPHRRSLPMTLYIITPFLGPALGPLIGGFVTTRKDWRWLSWTILFFTIAALTPALFMKETYKRRILKQRARKLRVEGPTGPTDGKTLLQTVKTFARSGLTRPMHMLMTEPVVASFTLYTSFNFALVYAFFAAFPYVFETYYDFSVETTGLTFIGLGVGCIIACGIIILVDRTVYQPKVRAAANTNPTSGATSKVPPEQRLYLALIGGPLITAGLFIFGWTAFVSAPWIAPVIGEMLFGCGNLLVFMSATMYIMDTYGPLYGASAMAANTLTRYILGTAFPLFAVQMFEGMGVQWACTLLGCVSLVWCAVPWVLWSWGAQARARTGYKHGN